MLKEIIKINDEMKKVTESYKLNYITANEYEKNILALYEKKVKNSMELVNKLVEYKELNRTDLISDLLK
ncbi:MAG TPA: hypothetical protein DDW20_03960 [Firmicutes bacterium]|nr:hypothetical protein [Bacillota bacterium]